jgi:hypothetical protein
MPIIHYPGFITKEAAATRYQVQVRTINDWIRKVSPAPESFRYITINGFVYIKDHISNEPPSVPVALSSLEWVTKFAERHKVYFERLYEQIIMGNITGVVLVDRIFVINTEPQLLAYLANYKKRKRDLRR